METDYSVRDIKSGDQDEINIPSIGNALATRLKISYRYLYYS